MQSCGCKPHLRWRCLDGVVVRLQTAPILAASVDAEVRLCSRAVTNRIYAGGASTVQSCGYKPHLQWRCPSDVEARRCSRAVANRTYAGGVR